MTMINGDEVQLKIHRWPVVDNHGMTICILISIMHGMCQNASFDKFLRSYITRGLFDAGIERQDQSRLLLKNPVYFMWNWPLNFNTDRYYTGSQYTILSLPNTLCVAVIKTKGRVITRQWNIKTVSHETGVFAHRILWKTNAFYSSNIP